MKKGGFANASRPAMRRSVMALIKHFNSAMPDMDEKPAFALKKSHSLIINYTFIPE
jgi:hypothetical protein